MPLLINAYSTLNAPPELTCRHKLIGRRSLSDPELVEHLRGFAGYVWSKSGGEMTQSTYAVLQFIDRVSHQYSFEVREDDFGSLASWGWSANALLFLQNGSVTDPDRRVLVDAMGRGPDTAARIPYPRDAVERKSRTDADLLRMGVPVLSALPPVISAYEVRMRTAEEVARRMTALLLTALRAESMAIGKPIPATEFQSRCPVGVAAMTRSEWAFVWNDSPSEQEIVDFGFRYECAALLQWALGLVQELPFPSSLCDCAKTARTGLDNCSESFLTVARLRPIPEILNALDLHFRLAWATRQVRAADPPMPAALHPGVVRERHYTLNWLIRFENKDWDDVQTPT